MNLPLAYWQVLPESVRGFLANLGLVLVIFLLGAFFFPLATFLGGNSFSGKIFLDACCIAGILTAFLEVR